MKEKRHIGEILRGADEPTAERIAELSPPADAETKDRIFAQIQERMGTPESQAEEHFTVTTVHRPWKKYAAAAASLLLAIGIGGAVLMRGLPSQPPVQEEQGAAQYAEGTAQDLSAELEGTCVVAVPETEVLPEHAWTQDEVWNLCMKSHENLMEYGRFSCDFSEVFYTENASEPKMQGVVELDFTAQTYNSCASLFDGYQNDSITIQENQWYYADGCELWLIDYQFPDTSTEDFGKFNQTEQAFLFEGRGNGDIVCNTPIYTETYLSDFGAWEIIGTDVYCHRADDGSGQETERACIVLEIADGVFQDELEAASHRVYVDEETGIWLKVEGFDENGNSVRKIQLNDLKFGADAEITHPYMIGQKIENGDYYFAAPTALTDVFLIFPTDAPEETIAEEETTVEPTTVEETIAEEETMAEPTTVEETMAEPTTTEETTAEPTAEIVVEG